LTQRVSDRQIDPQSKAGDLTSDGSAIGRILHNRAAVAAPTGSDDFAAGWSIGSTWIYGTAIYLCTGDGAWAQVSTAGHGHAIGDVAGLQTSLDAKQPSNARLNEIAGLVLASNAGKLIGVNPGETALELIDAASGGGLSDWGELDQCNERKYSTYVTFNNWDMNGCVSVYSSGAGFTVSENGYYLILGHFQFVYYGSGDMMLTIRKNGSNTNKFIKHYKNVSGDYQDFTTQFYDVEYLNSGDNIRFYFTDPGSCRISWNCRAFMMKLG
jgi:hypothetical protein